MIDPAEHLGLAQHYVTKLCGGKWPPHQMPDLFASACLGLVEAAQTFDPTRGNFAGHAYFRVRLRIIREQRQLLWSKRDNSRANKGKALTLHHVPLDDVDVGGEEYNHHATPATQLTGLLERERVALLYQALAKLPPFFRLILVHSQGLCGQPVMSYEEMAKELGATRRQIKSAMGRARARLAEEIRAIESADQPPAACCDQPDHPRPASPRP